MDFLEYGIKNKDNQSVIKRTVAKQILAVEQKKADIYEAYVNAKNIPIPEDAGDDAALFQRICEKIEENEQE